MALLSANDGAHNHLGLHHLQDQEIGGRIDVEMGWASQLGPTGLGPLGPIRSPLLPCGSSRHFGPEPL
jgi:hypothetical protein